MKNTLIISLFVVFVNTTCNTPKSKNTYLKEYQKFILQVKNEWQTYTQKEWDEMTQKNHQYSTYYYEVFFKEMSAAEIIRVNRFRFAFLFYKGDITIKALLSGKYNALFKESLNEVKNINVEILLGVNDIRNEQLITIIDRLIQ